MKIALELEDAEQAYYTQWWRWGYDDQPPLYTWIQKIFNGFFGVSRFSFSIVRGLFFSGVLVSFFHFVGSYLRTIEKSGIAYLLLVFVPVFIDFAFRRLSHTVLMCLLIMLTLNVFLRLLEKRKLKGYFLLGICIGLGILSKYTYVFFVAAMAMLAFFDVSVRKVYADKRIVLTIFVAAILNLPHIIWLFSAGHLSETLSSLQFKVTKNAPGTFVTSPLYTVVKAIVQLVLPLTILLGVLFLFKKVSWNKKAKIDWFGRLFLLEIVLLVGAVIVIGAEKVETRWLLPLFLPFLALVPKYFDFRQEEALMRWGTIVFLLVLFFQMVRTPVEKVFGIPSSVHNDYGVIQDSMEKKFGRHQWILPDVTYCGQIRLLDPYRKVFARDDYSLSFSNGNGNRFVLVTKGMAHEDSNWVLQDSILDFGKEKENLYVHEYHGVKNTPLQFPFSFEYKIRK